MADLKRENWGEAVKESVEFPPFFTAWAGRLGIGLFKFFIFKLFNLMCGRNGVPIGVGSPAIILDAWQVTGHELGLNLDVRENGATDREYLGTDGVAHGIFMQGNLKVLELFDGERLRFGLITQTFIERNIETRLNVGSAGLNVDDASLGIEQRSKRATWFQALHFRINYMPFANGEMSQCAVGCFDTESGIVEPGDAFFPRCIHEAWYDSPVGYRVRGCPGRRPNDERVR